MNIQYRICKKCNIEHVENCHTCFGFGLKCSKNEKYVPITASESIDWRGEHYLKCPECGGIPTLF